MSWFGKAAVQHLVLDFKIQANSVGENSLISILSFTIQKHILLFSDYIDHVFILL
uniref:Uncharacterized protein n=1 Tax=Arundo donax TaxID=35708 RepID=A0A0A8YLS6_ARUDO